MIIIDVTKFNSIEHALKVYKNKTNKIGTVRELRDRQVFVKPSVERRAEIKKAVYIEKKFNNIYASTIFGNVQGNFVGALSGIASSANKMTTATNFSIAGDVTSSAVVNFDGTGGTKTFNVSIDNSFITNKTLYTDVVKNNEEIIGNKVEHTKVR